MPIILYFINDASQWQYGLAFELKRMDIIGYKSDLIQKKAKLNIDRKSVV